MNYRHIVIYLLVFTSLVFSTELRAEITDNLQYDVQYIVRLQNGDIISGVFDSYVSDPEDGDGIQLRTEVGTAVIYNYQIVEIGEKNNYYRHNHRIYILPTAEPIKNNHYIGNFELMMLYFGAGFGDIVSISGGRSIIPGVPGRHQISTLNLKATLYSSYFGSVNRTLGFALGGNMAFINDRNRFLHLYGVGTLKLSRTSITASMFGKVGGGEFYDVRFGYENLYSMYYEDGAIGIGLGLDTKFSKTHNIHFIGEVWNSNIAKPQNSGFLLGFRLCNSTVAADFGLAVFTAPFIVPFTSFVWTPF